MRDKFRCDCPISSALDILGDKWTLVLVKQMLLEDKRTFKDFLESEEAIASNILSSRLKMLEEFKIIRKEKLPDNKKTNLYRLSEKGLGLAPVIIELALWSGEHVREFHPGIEMDSRLTHRSKKAFVQQLVENYKAKWEKLQT